MIEGWAPPRLLDAGDGGLVVEFGDDVDEGVNMRVVALGSAIEALGLAGLKEVVPTYRSLLLVYDPLTLAPDRLRAEVGALQARASQREDNCAALGSSAVPERTDESRAIWRVPVLYGGEHGVDLDHVAALHDLSSDEAIALHSSAIYRVHMIGFAPGFAYLGGLPEALHTSRRADPRPRTPPRSVSIGGRQAAVSPPLEVPSGWRLLGQTPVRSYDPTRNGRPFLFEAGDRIRFEPISAREYERLCRAAEAGEIVAEREAAL
jgi:KipI family sensor histidine kinase inhibitor